jgi:hypothetical protein
MPKHVDISSIKLIRDLRASFLAIGLETCSASVPAAVNTLVDPK